MNMYAFAICLMPYAVVCIGLRSHVCHMSFTCEPYQFIPFSIAQVHRKPNFTNSTLCNIDLPTKSLEIQVLSHCYENKEFHFGLSGRSCCLGNNVIIESITDSTGKFTSFPPIISHSLNLKHLFQFHRYCVSVYHLLK